MGTSLNTRQILAELHQEQAFWNALLDDIGEANMTQPEVAGGWSIKDIVAHITGWRRRTVQRFQAELRHEPGSAPPWPPDLQEDDDINAWLYEANRDRPLADVLSESRDVFRQLVETLETGSTEDLQNLQQCAWLVAWLEGEPFNGNAFFSHFHKEHEPDMRAWLVRVRKGR